MQKILPIVLAILMVWINGYSQSKPKTIQLDANILIKSKKELSSGSLPHKKAVEELKEKANRILKKPPYTIVNKSFVPPSGSKHDYLSLAPYWWPDHSKLDGLPYIHKDGKTNPEANETKDKDYVIGLSRDVYVLGLAYFFTEEEQYAAKAEELLNAFFINKETSMHPNLNYAHAKRGIVDGQVTGLIETIHFVDLLDGVQLLDGSKGWTLKDQELLESWFSHFLAWMMNSRVGKEGAKAPNNIGTYYDLQIITYALFTQDTILARSYIKNKTVKRIYDQFSTDGSQPYELKRPRSWTYSIKNLNGWLSIARVSEKAGINLWYYKRGEKEILREGILWLLPYASGEKEWQYKELSSGLRYDWFVPIARTGAFIYNDSDLHSYLSNSSVRPHNVQNWTILTEKEASE